MIKEKISIQQVQQGVYRIIFNETPKIEQTIYWGKKPTKTLADKTFVCRTKEREITCEIQSDTRVYFIVKSGEDIEVVGERTLLIEGMNNFRDLGGYLTQNGKRIKWGMLYRSDHVHNATKKGLMILQKLGIQTIIDYRSTDEIVKYPNPKIGDETTFQLDPKAHTAELSAQFTSDKENEDTFLIDKITAQMQAGKLVSQHDIVLKQYANFVQKAESQKAFGEMIHAAIRQGGPAVLQHCRGGKDRTGFGAMLLLGLLGVNDEIIIADYMLTYYNRLARNEEKMKNYRRITQDQRVLDYLYSLIATDPTFIETSLRIIRETYQSFENYSKEHLQLTDMDIMTLRNMYLE